MLAFHRYAASALAALVIVLPPIFAQEAAAPSPAPVEVKPVFGQPKVEVLQVEDEPNRHYEKWRVTTLMVLANLLPSSQNITYSTQPVARPLFTMRLQTNERKADLRKRFAQLKDELQAATFAELDVRKGAPRYQEWSDKIGQVEPAGPKFKFWELRQLTGFGESSFGSNTLRPTARTGWVCYVELVRDYEIEGAKIGKKTLFKAQVKPGMQGPSTAPLEFGRVFNIETGKIEKAK